MIRLAKKKKKPKQVHTVKARKIKFDIEKIFPVADPQSVPLLRLMMAADDVRHLSKLFVSATHRLKEANSIESSILDGELAHLFKLLSGHLFEAGKAFRNLEETCPGDLDKAVAHNDQRKADFNYL